MAEHINNFSGGMFKDTSLIYQPDGTYRHLKNCQLINQDGNNYTIKDCLGNRLTFTLPIAYDAIISALQTQPICIGFISFPNKLVVFHTNNESAIGGYGEIGVLNYENYGQSIEGTSGVSYVPLYHHLSLAFSRRYAINNEGFAYRENETIERVYWTDDFNEPKVFDIANPIFSTYYPAGGAGSVVSGDTYMVLQGAIVHNGINYGPGLTATNIFTAINTTITVASGTPLVIKYYPYQLLAWTPSRSLGNINFLEYGTGTVNCGNKMYFYRLKSTSASYSTPWSYGCFPVHVGNQNDIITGNAFHDFVGAGSTSTIINSSRSVKVKIQNIDTNFDTIEMACVEFDQAIDIPYSISIVQSATITGTTMTLEHSGATNLGTLTLNDLTLFPASILRCKTITTNKNYNIIANITERTEFDFDVSGITISQFQYPMPSHLDSDSCANGYIYANPGPSAIVYTVAGIATLIQPHSRYLVGGTGTVTYNGVTYGQGDVFIGVAGVSSTSASTLVPTLTPCVSLNNYTITATPTVQRKTNIPFNNLANAFWNYKNPVVESLLKGYWSTEKYRIGILFYDLKGNPYYVRWINDYTFGTIAAKSGLLIADAYNGTNQWSVNPSLLTLSGITIPSTLIDLISGFSIVRAERDPQVITQGLVIQTSSVVSGGINLITPISCLLPAYDDYVVLSGNIPHPRAYSWLIPDNNTRIPLRKSIGTVGDTMKEAGWLGPITWSGGAYQIRSEVTKADNYQKYFVAQGADVSSPRSNTFDKWFDIADNGYVTGFDSTSDFRNATLNMSGGAIADPTCVGGGADNIIAGRFAIGGQKIAVQPVGDFFHYNTTAYYYSGPGTGAWLQTNPYHILMNYYIPNSNLYGGQGLAALANTNYISTGHFQPITAQVKTDTFDAGTGSYIFNGVQVGGGDCFTNLIDYGYALADNISYPGNEYSLGLYFPCENNSNTYLIRGRKISNSQMGVNTSNGVAYNDSNVTRLEDFSYNSGYSSEGRLILYPALPVDFSNAGRFEFRIRFAGQKFIGEIIDSFRTFLDLDRKEVDGLLGEINNVRSKGDYIYYLQNHGVGSAPVLQRQLISGDDGAATILGTGGVIDSFNTISTLYGNQHKHGLTQTDFGWIWFDMRNKDVCVMEWGGGAYSITTPKGMKSYFNEVFLERSTDVHNVAYLNSPGSFATSDQPLMGIGIIGVYDPKLQTSYLTFKFKNQKTDGVTYDNILNKDFTIAYHHIEKKFIGFYDKTPAIWHNHNQIVLSCNNPKNPTKYYGASMVSTDFVIGDIIAYNNTEYVCYTNGTVPAFVSPSALLFVGVNKTNEIYVENQESNYHPAVPGYQYNKFYGIVVSNEIEIVVNPKPGEPFVVDNLIQSGNNVPITDAYYDNTDQSASDLSISATSRDYVYKDGIWSNGIPFSSTGRFYDQFLKVKLVKKNYTNDPTNRTTAVKLLNYIKAIFRTVK